MSSKMVTQFVFPYVLPVPAEGTVELGFGMMTLRNVSLKGASGREAEGVAAKAAEIGTFLAMLRSIIAPQRYPCLSLGMRYGREIRETIYMG
jgi:hypothetical protein